MVLSSSASAAEPVHVSVDVRVAVLGERETVATGARLLSVRLSLPLSLPPSASVAVTVQATVSREPASALVSERVAPLPIEVASLVFVQA